jgi:hypothetical protein
MPPSSTVHSHRTAPCRSRFCRSVPGGGNRESAAAGADAAAWGSGAVVASFAGAVFLADFFGWVFVFFDMVVLLQ